MMAITLPQVLNLTIKPVADWIKTRRLQAYRARCLRDIEVCERAIANDQAVIRQRQLEEMQCRNALRDLEKAK